jgi:Mn2+/Fe2+ NRAMP family transporter
MSKAVERCCQVDARQSIVIHASAKSTALLTCGANRIGAAVVLNPRVGTPLKVTPQISGIANVYITIHTSSKIAGVATK